MIREVNINTVVDYAEEPSQSVETIIINLTNYLGIYYDDKTHFPEEDTFSINMRSLYDLKVQLAEKLGDTYFYDCIFSVNKSFSKDDKVYFTFEDTEARIIDDKVKRDIIILGKLKFKGESG